jgi:hypothetical protein
MDRRGASVSRGNRPSAQSTRTLVYAISLGMLLCACSRPTVHTEGAHHSAETEKTNTAPDATSSDESTATTAMPTPVGKPLEAPEHSTDTLQNDVQMVENHHDEAASDAEPFAPKHRTLELRAPEDPSDEPRKAKEIMDRINEIAGDSLASWCADVGLQYPPEGVLFRAFKRQREFEIWAKNKDMEQLVLLATLPICAMDFEPGPKLQEGDGKTPEGFYHPSPLYWSSLWFMWMKLDPESIDSYGRKDQGSAFRLCIEYPNKTDKKRSKSIDIDNPGSAICVHGNCVSAGCLSFENRDFLAIFAFAMQHDEKRFSKLELQIFPFRFDDTIDLAKEAEMAAQASTNAQQLGSEAILAEWELLKTEYLRFKDTRSFR